MKYARVEKIRRFFKLKRQKIFKMFLEKPYQSNFVPRHIEEFVLAIDDML